MMCHSEREQILWSLFLSAHFKGAGPKPSGQVQKIGEISIQEDQNTELPGFKNKFNINMVFVIANFFNQNLRDLAEKERRDGLP